MTNHLRAVDDGGIWKLLANGSSLVYDDGTNPCCCDCCVKLESCISAGTYIYVDCGDFDPTPSVDDVFEIDGICYTVVEIQSSCTEMLTTVSSIESRSSCSACCGCDNTNDLPDSITLLISSLEHYYFQIDCYCHSCDSLLGAYTLTKVAGTCIWVSDCILVEDCFWCYTGPCNYYNAYFRWKVTLLSGTLSVHLEMWSDPSNLSTECLPTSYPCSTAGITLGANSQSGVRYSVNVSADPCKGEEIEVTGSPSISGYARGISNCYPDSPPVVIW